MPYYKTSQEWLEQSSRLLEARPSTTRITTRYSIKTPKPRRNPTTESGGEDSSSSAPAAAAAAKPPRGSLEIKTYDPVSGVTLKYRTTKAAEVSRLIHASLGRLGRDMAAVPSVPEEAMPDAPAGSAAAAVADGQADGGPGATDQKGPQQAAQQQPGGGGKKKKRGKK